MLRYRAAAPWTVCLGNTGPFSVVMGSLPRAMCSELVAVTSLCSKYITAVVQGSALAWQRAVVRPVSLVQYLRSSSEVAGG